MRGRLLDMGEVGPLRCESLARALPAAAHPGGEPVLLLIRPAAAYLATGDGRAAPPLPGGLASLPRSDSGAEWLVDPGQLHFQLVLPGPEAGPATAPGSTPGSRSEGAAGAETGAGSLPRLAAPLLEALAALGVRATLAEDGTVVAGGAALGAVALAGPDGAKGLRGFVRWRLDPAAAAAGGIDPARLASLVGLAGDRTVADGPTALRGEVSPQPPSLADLAEALVGTLESAWGIELVPSMPTTDELDLVWSWDERLTALAAGEAPAAVATPAEGAN